MSRRTRLGPDSTLLMQQRRGVPNARMWSEAPFHTPAGWDGLESEPDYVKPLVLPTRYVSVAWYSGGWIGEPPSGSTTWSESVAAGTLFPNWVGTEVLMFLVTRGMVDPVINPMWTVVATGSVGGHYLRWYVLRWTWNWPAPTSSGQTLTFPIASNWTEEKQGNYVGWRSRMLVFGGHSGGAWKVIPRNSGQSSTFRWTAADAPGFTLQVMFSIAAYSGWEVPPTDPAWSFVEMGNIGGWPGFVDRIGIDSGTGSWRDPAPDFTADLFYDGTAVTKTIGVMGLPHFQEIHLRYE